MKLDKDQQLFKVALKRMRKLREMTGKARLLKEYLVLMALMAGPLRFNELVEMMPYTKRALVVGELNYLCDIGLVGTNNIAKKGRERFEYYITQEGEEFRAFLEMINHAYEFNEPKVKYEPEQLFNLIDPMVASFLAEVVAHPNDETYLKLETYSPSGWLPELKLYYKPSKFMQNKKVVSLIKQSLRPEEVRKTNRGSKK